RGTLFIDEVGAMPLGAQAKLLRVIQDGELQRLGDERPAVVDVRIVAATNSDLEADVAAGRFRSDLFYRLNVLRVEVPPLRERKEDIPLLAAHAVAQVARRLRRPPPALGPAALAELAAYDWPGNVRELWNVLERALILQPEGSLESLGLSPVAARPADGSAAAPDGPEATGEAPRPDEGLDLRTALGRCERAAVVEALRRSQGVRKEAARLLGIDQRNLGYYVRKHGI